MSEKKRERAYNFNVTCWNKDVLQSDVYSNIVKSGRIVEYIIGETEKTEKGEPHFHVYLECNGQVDFSVIKSICGEMSHIEKAIKGAVANYNYCCKNGVYMSTFSVEDINKMAGQDDADIENALIIDIFERGLNIYQIVRKYPKFALYRINAIKELFAIKNEEDLKNKKNDYIREL